jgi:hypothetical protein
MSIYAPFEVYEQQIADIENHKINKMQVIDLITNYHVLPLGMNHKVSNFDHANQIRA